METLLHDQADHETASSGDGRALLVARAYSALLDDPAALPRTALDHFAELAEGGRVPLADLREDVRV
jgi:hypothetical protein